ncbi:hypothetical protein IAU60_005954 [Kwoniella sp. DSM 27419]
MTSRACFRCVTRKRKCDRKHPQCSVCQHSGEACEYPRGTQRRGPLPGYAQKLERRMREYERALAFVLSIPLVQDALEAIQSAQEPIPELSQAADYDREYETQQWEERPLTTFGDVLEWKRNLPGVGPIRQRSPARSGSTILCELVPGAEGSGRALTGFDHIADHLVPYTRPSQTQTRPERPSPITATAMSRSSGLVPLESLYDRNVSPRLSDLSAGQDPRAVGDQPEVTVRDASAHDGPRADTVGRFLEEPMHFAPSIAVHDMTSGTERIERHPTPAHTQNWSNIASSLFPQLSSEREETANIRPRRKKAKLYW